MNNHLAKIQAYLDDSALYYNDEGRVRENAEEVFFLAQELLTFVRRGGNQPNWAEFPEATLWVEGLSRALA